MNKIFTFIKPWLYKYKRILPLLSMVIISSAFLSLINPWIMGNFIDFLSNNDRLGMDTSGYMMLFVSSTILSLSASYIHNIIVVKYSTKIVFDISKTTLEHIESVNNNDLGMLNSSSLAQAINSDTNQIVNFVFSFIDCAVKNFIELIVSAYFLIKINCTIFIIVVIFFILYIFLYYIVKEKIFNLNKVFIEEQVKFFGIYENLIKFQKFISNNALVSPMISCIEDSFQYLYKSAISLQRFIYFLRSLDSFITMVSQLIVFVFGIYLIQSGEITLGLFTMAISYISTFMSSSSNFSIFWKESSSVLPSVYRLEKLINIPCSFKVSKFDEKYRINNAASIERVSVDNLSCKVGLRQVFSNVSCLMEKGKVYAVVGDNGSGKSTLVDCLLYNFKKNITGEIYFDDYLIDNIDLYDLRKFFISVCEQTPVIFEGSLKFNLFFGEKKEEESLLLLDKLGFDLTKHNLMDIISESTLSEGEKQKIAIARTILRDNPIEIYDEPSSSLDYSSKTKLINIINQRKNNKITIIISHDKEIIDICDEIISM